MTKLALPPFKPHPLFPGGHAQTLAGAYLPGKRYEYTATRHLVHLDDGDRLVLHDDCPSNWQTGGRTALLVHGLAGCHLSPYMVRIAAKLNAIGVRVFRMDLRTCGAGQKLARKPYHAGRSDDARAAIEQIAHLCPGSMTSVVGFSLGGNIVLKLLGESPDSVPTNVDCGAAVNPAADLSASVHALVGPLRSLYDRHFARLLRQQLHAARLTPESLGVSLPYEPRRIIEFDDLYTAKVWGFGTAEDYYAASSSAPHIAKIQVPTLIIAARDDPMVPVETIERITLSPAVLRHIVDHGGHIGYVGRQNGDPDRRWMDWRIVDWIQNAG